MQTKTKVDTCRECGNPIPEIEARRIGRVGLCEPCREKHRDAWREENTRKPGDTRRGWLIGDECQRSEEHTSELQSHSDLVCRLLLEKKKKKKQRTTMIDETRMKLRSNYNTERKWTEMNKY